MSNKTTEAQLRASKKYHSKFIEMRIRVTPEERDTIIKHYSEAGDQSTSAFFKRAINETMDRDLRDGKVTTDFRKSECD